MVRSSIFHHFRLLTLIVIEIVTVEIVIFVTEIQITEGNLRELAKNR